MGRRRIAQHKRPDRVPAAPRARQVREPGPLRRV